MNRNGVTARKRDRVTQCLVWLQRAPGLAWPRTFAKASTCRFVILPLADIDIGSSAYKQSPASHCRYFFGLSPQHRGCTWGGHMHIFPTATREQTQIMLCTSVTRFQGSVMEDTVPPKTGTYQTSHPQLAFVRIQSRASFAPRLYWLPPNAAFSSDRWLAWPIPRSSPSIRT